MNLETGPEILQKTWHATEFQASDGVAYLFLRFKDDGVFHADNSWWKSYL